MSESLEVRVAPGTVKELGDLLEKMDQVALSAAKMAGSGKALEELRKIMVGVGRSGSAFSELRQSMDNLNKGLTDSIKQMVATVQNLPAQLAESMKGMSVTMKASGEAAGKALGDGISTSATKSINAAKGTVKAEIQKLQKEYEAISANPNATIKLPALANLASSGVQLFPSDRDRLDTYRKTQQTYDSMYSYGVQTAKKTASFQLQVARETQATYNYIYRTGVADRQRIEAEAVASFNANIARKVGVATTNAMGDYSSLTTYKTVSNQAAKDIAAFQVKVAADTQSTLNAMYRAGVAERKRMEEEAAASYNGGIARKVALATTNASGAYTSLSTYKVVDTEETKQAAAAAKKAVAEIEAFKVSVSRETQNTLNAMYRRGVSDRKRMEEEVASAFNANIARQVGVATSRAAGAYSSLTTFKEITPKAPITPDPAPIERGASALQKLNTALGVFTGNAGDAHSATRGLASGFNLLWLTWGNLAPLMAGAAISNAAVQMVKLGVATEQSLRFMAVASDDSLSQLNAINKAMQELSSKGPFGPVAVAEALKTMALAGMNAKERIDSLSTVMQFGMLTPEMTLGKSTEALIAIGTSFGYVAKELSVVGDVITRTANVSMASTEGMSAAFRQASVVAQQYGVSLTDTATALALLHQVGIKESAAGTAMRQMYNELIGASAKTRKVIAELGLETWDTANNKMLPFATIMGNLAGVMEKFSSKGRIQALLDLFNERGLKGSSAALSALSTKLSETGESAAQMKSRFQDMADKIAEAPGTMALATAALATTSENMMKSVKSALETSLGKAFEELKPALTLVSAQLNSVFNSPEFITGLKTLGASLANLTAFVVSHGKVIYEAAQAYIVWKAAVAGFFIFQRLAIIINGVSVAISTAAVAAVTAGRSFGVAAAGVTAMGAASAASVAPAAAAAAGLVGLNAALGVIGLVAAGATAAYLLFFKEVKAGSEAKVKSMELASATTLKAMDDEIARLDKLMAAKGQDISSDLAAQAVRAGLARDEISARYNIADAALSEAEAIARVRKERVTEAAIARGYALDSSYVQGGISKADASIATIVQQRISLRKEEFREVEKFSAKSAELIDKAKAYAKAADEAVAKRKQAVFGTEDWNGPAKTAKPAKEAKTHAENLAQDLITVERDGFTKRMANLKAFFTDEQQLLNAEYQAKLISAGEFEAKSIVLQAQSDAARLDAIDKFSKTAQAKINTAMASLTNQAGGENNMERLLGLHEGAYKKLSPELQHIVEQYRKVSKEQGLLTTSVKESTVAVNNETAARVKQATVKFDGAIKAEALAYASLNAEIGGTTAKLQAKLAVEAAGLSVSDRERAGLAAAAELEGQYAKQLAERADKIASMEEGNYALLAQIALLTDAEGTHASEIVALSEAYVQGAAAVETFKTNLENLKDQLAKNKGKAHNLGVAAFDVKEATKMRDDISSAIVQGLMKGREAGKSIWLTFRDWMKNSLANMATKGFQNITGGLMQNLGFNMGGSAAGGAGGGGTNLLTSALTNFGSSAMGKIVGGGGGFGGEFGSWVSSGQQAMQTMLGTSNTLAATSTEFMGVGSTVAENAALMEANGVVLAETASTAGTMMSTLSAAAPYIAAAIMIAYALSKESTPHTGGYSYSDASGTRDITLAANDPLSGPGSINGIQNTELQGLMTDLSKNLSGTLNGLATDFGKEAVYGVKAVFESDKNDPSWAEFKITKSGAEAFGSVPGTMTNLDKDPAKGLVEYGKSAASGTRDAMLAMDFLPQWFKKALNELGDTVDVDKLNATVAELRKTQVAIVSVQTALKPMGGVFTKLSELGSDAFATMATAAGGLDKLGTSLSDYYTNFYSESERSSQSLSYLTSEFGKLNMGAMPTAKEGFRTLIDSFINGGKAGTEEGQKTLVTLLQLANGYSSLQTVVEDTSKKTGLEVALLRAQGNEVAAVAKEREIELAALAATNPELVELQKQVWKVGDASEAAAKAAEKLAEVMAERSTLEDRLYTVTKDTVAIRAKEREAVDPLNRSLYDMIVALEDAASAAEAFKNIGNTLKEAVSAALAELRTAIDAEAAKLKKTYDTKVGELNDAKKAAQDTYDNKLKEITARKEDAKAAYDATTIRINKQIKDLDADVKATAKQYKLDSEALSKEKTDATKLYKEQSTVLKDFIKKQTEVVNTLKTVNDSLESTLRQMIPIGQEAVTRQRAQAQLAGMLATARTTGNLPQSKADVQAMQDALSTVAKPSEELFGSFLDYQRDFYRTAIDIRDLNDIATRQYDAANTALTTAQTDSDNLDARHQENMDRLDALKERLDKNNEIATESYNTQRESLQSQLDNAKDQYDATLGGLDSQEKTAKQALDAALESAAKSLETLDKQLEADLAKLEGIYEEAKKHTASLTGIGADATTIASSQVKLEKAITDFLNGTGQGSKNPSGTGNTTIKDKWVTDTSGKVDMYVDSGGAVGVKPNGAGAIDTVIKAKDDSTFTMPQMIEFVSSRLLAKDYAAIGEASKVKGMSLATIDSVFNFSYGTMDALVNKGGRFKNYTGADIAAFIEFAKANSPDTKSAMKMIRDKAIEVGYTSHTLDAMMGWENGYANKIAAEYGLAAFSVGGTFGGGMALVGERGPELVSMGPSRIYNNADTKRMLESGNRDGAIIEWLQKLTDQVTAMHQDNNAGQQAIATSTGRTARVIVDRWEVDGMPATRT